jgi:L,D-transpeptidase ErfK/SrfK
MRKSCLGILVGLGLVVTMGQSAFAAYDLPYIGEMKEYRTKYEDTLVHIARDFNIGFVELRAANPYVDPWLPGAGTTLTIPDRHILPDAPREGVVINLADMRLYAFNKNGDAPYSTPVGIGREGLNTPLGTTTIVRKTEGPTWRPTDRMRKEDPKLPAVVPPGDDNPMGTHALYLGFPLVAIHGTNKPFGIGRRTSSGCLRLYPEAIIKVYDMFPVGTKVTVVNQPIKTAWIGDELYLEASPTVEQSVQMEEMGEVAEEKLTNAEMKTIIKAAGAYQDRLRWPTIRKAIKERNSYPVAIARRPSVSVEGDKVVDTKESDAELMTPEEALDLLENPGPVQKKSTVVKAGEHGALMPNAPRTKNVAVKDEALEEIDEHNPKSKNVQLVSEKPSKADQDAALDKRIKTLNP